MMVAGEMEDLVLLPVPKLELHKKRRRNSHNKIAEQVGKLFTARHELGETTARVNNCGRRIDMLSP